MHPLLIAQIEPPQAAGGGDYYYRTHAPGRTMAEADDVYVVNLTAEHRLRDEIAAQADALILKNICDPDFLVCIRKRKEQNKPTFYEIADDLKAVPSWNPVHFFYQDAENQRLFQRLARACDGLQFTCRRLRDLYGHLNAHNQVFPNQILELPPERNCVREGRIVVGWGGSHGHLEDLAEIAAALIAWLRARPDCGLHLMCSEPIWKLFETLPASQKKHTPPGTVDDYYRFLAQVDIGLIPMKETAFNRGRSDIKFVEYAAAGVAAVIRKMDPYEESVRHGENALLYEKTGELPERLEQLYQDRGLLARLAKAARDYVARNRLQQKHTRERFDFYQAVPLPATAAHPAPDRFADWSRLAGAEARGRHLRLGATRFEQLLHDGLVTLQVQKDPETAKRMFAEAKRLEPGNYLPYLFGAQIAADPAAELGGALRRNPHSIRARVLLGEHRARHARIPEAMRAFEEAANLFPDYEVPYARAADLLQRSGQKAEAQKLYARAGELIDQLCKAGM